MVNKVILIGNLGKDPETRTLGNGAKVCKFSLATTERYKDKSGQNVEKTEWHNVELWDGLAAIADQYLTQGSKVYVEGKIKTEKYEKDGQTRYLTKIRAYNMKMLGGKPEAHSETPREAARKDAPAHTEEEDDLPF